MREQSNEEVRNGRNGKERSRGRSKREVKDEKERVEQ